MVSRAPTSHIRLSRRQGTARLVELLIIGLLILALVRTVAQSVWDVRVSAEEAAVTHTVGTLQSTLGMALATGVVRNGLDYVARLDRSNPMQLLDPPPPNYQGELQGADPHAVAGPAWYFDREKRLLVYRPGFTEAFFSDAPGEPRARFQVQLQFTDSNRDGRFDAGIDAMTGLHLVSLDRFGWERNE